LKWKWIFLCLVALSAIAATMASGAYVARIGEDAGGGPALSTTLRTKGSIGGSVDGETKSTNWTGALPRTPIPPVVVVEGVSKPALTTGEECIISWHSTIDGYFYVEVGGNGTPGSGGRVDEGPCTAYVSIESKVYESDLPDNQDSPVYIIVDTGLGTPPYGTVTLTDDQIAPEFAAFDIVRIQGTVSDSSVTEVVIKVAGQPDWQVPVISGSYDCTTPLGLSPSGTTEVILEATNSEGKSVQRKIKMW